MIILPTIIFSTPQNTAVYRSDRSSKDSIRLTKRFVLHTVLQKITLGLQSFKSEHQRPGRDKRVDTIYLHPRHSIRIWRHNRGILAFGYKRDGDSPYLLYT